LIYVAIKNIKTKPIISFSIIWFFITILPVSNIIPQGNIFAERYLYLPSVGFCTGIALLLSWLLKKDVKTRFLNYKKTVYVLFFLLIIALGRITYERNKVWYNDFTLWTDTVEASPNSPAVHLNLAVVYYNLNLFDKAMSEINIYLKLKPLSSEALFILGNIYLKKGLLVKAIEEFRKVIDISPKHSKVYVSLSAAYYLNFQYQKAIEAALNALKLNPNLDSAHYNLALSYRNIGLTEEAISSFEDFLRTNPNRFDVNVEVGNLYYHKGNHQKAKEHWLKALEISKDYQPAKDALKLLKN